LLKKSLSDRSVAQNRSETPKNQGQNATKAAFSAPENRGTREHEGVFQHAGSFLVQQLDAGYSTELPSSRGVLGSSGEPSLLLALAPAQRPARMPITQSAKIVRQRETPPRCHAERRPLVVLGASGSAALSPGWAGTTVQGENPRAVVVGVRFLANLRAGGLHPFSDLIATLPPSVLSRRLR
jgi:hypothetical protein